MLYYVHITTSDTRAEFLTEIIWFSLTIFGLGLKYGKRGGITISIDVMMLQVQFDQCSSCSLTLRAAVSGLLTDESGPFVVTGGR